MSSTKKIQRAGGPQPWTTPEQREYLRSQCGAYKEATSKDDFWAKLLEHWFTKWPASSDLPTKGAVDGVGGRTRKPLTEKVKVKKVSELAPMSPHVY
jgi:hypothetical protein